MEKNSYISSSKPRGLRAGPVKVVFLTMLVVEIIVFHLGPYLKDQTDFIILNFKKTAVVKGGINADVLVIGDSVALFDFDVKTFSDAANLKAYNLGLMQTVPMPGFYFLLNDYLKRNAPPKYIIFLFADNYWNRELRDGFFQYGLFLGFYELPYIWDIFSSPFPGTKELALRLLPQNIPSYAFRDFLRYGIRSAFTGKNLIKEHFIKNRNTRKTLRANNGWYPLTGQIALTGKLAQGEKTDFQGEFLFKPSASNIYYFKRILSILKKYGVKPVYVFNPYRGERVRYPDRNVVSFIEGFKDIKVLDKDKPLFNAPLDYIGDESGHLNAAGAKQYSEYLADEFVKWLNTKMEE